jgi:hypothetical protein
MKLIPPLVTKLLTTAEAGELVRVPMGADGGSHLGIIAHPIGGGTGIIDLNSTPAGPRHISIPDRVPRFALSYGKSYAFHFPSGGRQATSFSKDFESPGAMIVSPTQTSIRGSLPSGDGFFFNISTISLRAN